MRRRFPAFAIVVCSALAGRAPGQEVPPAKPPPPDASGRAGSAAIEEIVVTAQRRSEKLERTPVAVSAYTSKQRDLLGIDTMQDISNFTPGLEYSTNLDRAYIRGIGRQTNNLSEDPGVATYDDGVYNASITAASGDSLFVNRVEVLRGPQGTLYGRNSIGGALNSVSQKPTDQFYAEERSVFGNYGVVDTEGAISGPLAKNVQGRIAFFNTNQNDGYFKNLSGNDGEGGRGRGHYVEAQLQAQITDNFDFWAKAAYYGYDNTFRASNTLGSYDYAPFPPGVLSPSAAYGLTLPGVSTFGPTIRLNPANQDIRAIDTNSSENARLSGDYLGVLQATYQLPIDAVIKYIGGYTIYRYRLDTDVDGTAVSSYPFPTTTGLPPLIVHPTDISSYKESKDYWSNEVDLASTGASRLTWIFGLYQYHETYDQPLDIAEPDQSQIFAPFQSSANPSGDIYHTDQTARNNSYAVFGQLDYKTGHDITLTGGVRYTEDEKSSTENTRLICLGLPICQAPASVYGAYTPAIDVTKYAISFAPGPGIAGPVIYDPNAGDYSRTLYGRWAAATGTVGAAWTPDPKTLVYARYGRGYKAGGFNAGFLAVDPETAPETINSFEAGVKEVFAAGLTTNFAVFDYGYDNLQIPLYELPPLGPERTILYNIARSRSFGAELEASWKATPSLQFLISYAYLNAQIIANTPLGDVVQPQLGPQNIVGQRLPQSPRNKLALNAVYTWRLAQGRLSLSGDYIFKDASYDSIFDRPWYRAPSYSQVDARLLFEDEKDRFTIIAFVKNLTNVTAYDNVSANYIQSPQAGYPGYNQQVFLIPPRIYGFEVQLRFR